MAERRRLPISLVGAGQIVRRHPDEVKPPGLVVARNVFLSRSDSLLTMRPLWVEYPTAFGAAHSSLASVWQRPATAEPSDFLAHAEYSVRSGFAVHWARMGPYAWTGAGRQNLHDTYVDGLITTSGTSVAVVGDGTTRWVQYVWPGCYVVVGGQWYLITAVTADDRLSTETAVPAQDGEPYVIVRPHHPDAALYPVHAVRFTTQLIYAVPVLQAPLPESKLAGPWYMPFDAVDAKVWTPDQQSREWTIVITAIAASVLGTAIDPKKVVCGSEGEVLAASTVFALQGSSVDPKAGSDPWSSHPPQCGAISGVAWGVTAGSDNFTLVPISSPPADWYYASTSTRVQFATDGVVGGYWMGTPTDGDSNADHVLVSTDPTNGASWSLAAGSTGSIYNRGTDLVYYGGSWYYAMQGSGNGTTVRIAISGDNGGTWVIKTRNDGGSLSNVEGPRIATNGLRWVCCIRSIYAYYSDDGFSTFVPATVDGVWDTSGGKAIFRVKYLNDRFVMVGDDGYIAYSLDGDTWTTATTAGTLDLYDVAYHDGVWVAVGASTGSMVSTDDAETWVLSDLPAAGAGGWANVIWTGFRWMATGDSHYATSDDGLTWLLSPEDTGRDHLRTAVNAAANLIVSVQGTGTGHDGDVMWWADGGASLVVCEADGGLHAMRTGTTDNGRRIRNIGAWEVQSHDGKVLNGCRNLNLTGAEFGLVDAAGNLIYGDPWGGWTTQATGESVALRDCATNGTHVVVVGDSDGTDAAIASCAAADFTAWTARTSGEAVSLRCVVYCPHLALWVAAGTGGTILTSPDMAVWTARTSGVTTTINGLATSRTGNVLVAVTAAADDVTAPNVIYSIDGITWETHTLEATELEGVSFTCAEWDDRQRTFLVGTDAARLLGFLPSSYFETYTPDGAVPGGAWGNYILPHATHHQLLRSGGTFVTCGPGGIWTGGLSPTAWVRRYSAKAIYGVAYDGSGEWVGVGANGTIVHRTAASPAGAWSACTSPVSTHLWAVVWDGANFVAVGDAGVVLKSNGVAVTSGWSALGSGTTEHLQCIAYSARVGAAVGVPRLFIGGDNGVFLRGETSGYTLTPVAASKWADTFGTGLTSGSAPTAAITSIAADATGGVVLMSNVRLFYARDDEEYRLNQGGFGSAIFGTTNGLAYSPELGLWVVAFSGYAWTGVPSYPGRVAYSLDGLTWSAITTPPAGLGSNLGSEKSDGGRLPMPILWDGTSFWGLSQYTGHERVLIGISDRATVLAEGEVT